MHTTICNQPCFIASHGFSSFSVNERQRSRNLSIQSTTIRYRSRNMRVINLKMCMSVEKESDIAFVLSHFEAAQFLSLRPKAKSLSSTQMVKGPFSVDIGSRSIESIFISSEGISKAEYEKSDDTTTGPTLATWEELRKMSKKGKTGAYECFKDGKSIPQKIAGISEQTQVTGSLHPCEEYKAPTLILGGFGMHRFKNTNPQADTIAKIKAVGHFHGHVLDICTGLGYTAIHAAKFEEVNKVTTIELDPLVISIQRRNPWSRELFENEKIQRLQGNGVDVIKQLASNTFSIVIHDPPAQRLAGHLFSEQFYKEIRRVIRTGGKLFHYIGDPDSDESGKLFAGVERRLRGVGFGEIEVNRKAYGLTAMAKE